MNRTIYVLAESFSDDRRECFFEKELPYLASVFEKVYVVALYPDDTVLKNSRSNIEVLHFNYFTPCNRIRVFFKHFFSIARLFLSELGKTHNKWFYFKNFAALLNQLVITFSAADRLERLIQKDINSHTLFYAFWFKQWVAALSIIRLRCPQLKFVSRVHGGDYDEDQIRTVLPFRYFQLSMVNHIFPVSDFGKNYLVKTFKVNPSRITTARLGLSLKPGKPPVDVHKLHLVSCSSVIELKRVHLILEIVNAMEIPCQWTHFGSGHLLEEIRKKAEASKQSIRFEGYVPNAEFIRFLGNNPVSLFINVSESEGIPVSMMEAIAHGIPLVGTHVCGVPEIVTERTGFLFPVNFRPAAVAETIIKAHTSQILYDPDFRSSITAFYETVFYEHNYKALARQLSEI